MYNITFLVAFFFSSIVFNLILLQWPFLYSFWICLIYQNLRIKSLEFTIILSNDFNLSLFIHFIYLCSLFKLVTISTALSFYLVTQHLFPHTTALILNYQLWFNELCRMFFLQHSLALSHILSYSNTLCDFIQMTTRWFNNWWIDIILIYIWKYLRLTSNPVEHNSLSEQVMHDRIDGQINPPTETQFINTLFFRVLWLPSDHYF